MADYNFKNITVVPSSTEFIDLILSKTQRKTATVVHKSYPISRIRGFYVRKVKFTQQNFHDRLSKILTDFPRLDDLHPFYADLYNVMYDRNHYKIALGQINTARNLIDQVGRDYARLLKYADSLYRCKMLKKTALGRMVTIIKRQNASLKFLNDVRQHMARLPAIDPNTRTLLITGFPNVGKSSLINKLTRAEVETASYAFTTKSLSVGHMDYRYLRWQVVDTPGLLDKPCEERSDIEMKTIVALAHLRAAIVYVMDVSEQCGESLESQLQLFENIRPLFTNKPIYVMANKTDVVGKDELSEENLKIFTDLEEKGVPVFWSSTKTEVGLMEMRQAACDKLLVQRVEAKLQSKSSGRVEASKNRIHVAVPVKRDDKERPAQIPAAVLAKRAKALEAGGSLTGEGMEVEPRKSERQLEIEQDDEYYLDMKKWYDLRNPEEKYDVIPEIWNGHNVADFVDPDLDAKLEELERQEGLREEAGYYDDDEESEDEETKEIRKMAQQIRDKRTIQLIESHLRRKVKKSKLPRKNMKEGLCPDDMVEDLGKIGIDLDDDAGSSHFRSRSLVRKSRKRKAPSSNMETTVSNRSQSRARSQSRPRSESGLRDENMVAKAKKMARIAQRPMIRLGKSGESDRHIPTLKPKHLLTGKRGVGKTDRR